MNSDVKGFAMRLEVFIYLSTKKHLVHFPSCWHENETLGKEFYRRKEKIEKVLEQLINEIVTRVKSLSKFF